MYFSVVIPARNEEKTLPRAIEALQHAAAQAACLIEIIVVANRCTDRTIEVAAELGAKVLNHEGKNLSAIRNHGVRAASADFVITVDADSVDSPRTFVAIKQKLSSGRSVGGGVLILPERYSLGIVLTGLALFPLALWYGISAGLFYCRREDFEAIGGFNEAIASAEDIDFAKRLRRHGKYSGRKFNTLYRTPIVTSCRKFDKFGDWYFLINPGVTFALLRGRNQALADRIWYDFEYRE